MVNYLELSSEKEGYPISDEQGLLALSTDNLWSLTMFLPRWHKAVS